MSTLFVYQSSYCKSNRYCNRQYQTTYVRYWGNL